MTIRVIHTKTWPPNWHCPEHGRNPWFDVIFLYQNYETASLDIPGIEVSAYEDQNVIAHEELITSPNAMATRSISIVYSMALFKRETAERYLFYYLNMVKEVLGESPDLRLSAIEMTEPSVVDQIGRDR